MWSPLPRALLTLSVLTLAASAHAQTAPAGFQSPSKNIACQYFDYDRQNILRCDIAAMETKPRRPADCELDYGGAFEMNAKGPAARICHGDTVMDKSLPVLGLRRTLATRRFYLQVGADGNHLLQCRPPRVFAGAGEAGGVLKSRSPFVMARADPAIHVFASLQKVRRRSPGQAR